MNAFFVYCSDHTGDSGGLIAALLIVGFLQGPLIPAVSAFAAPWFMAEERGRIISIIFMGINVSRTSNEILNQHKQRREHIKLNFDF